MDDKFRLVRFIKVYAIFNVILDEPTETIVNAYNSYASKYPTNLEDKAEFEQMKQFILRKEWLLK